MGRGTSGALPERLSPSRVKDFIQCPRLFYYRSVLGIPTPPTEATLRGNLAHTAFELLFDRPRGDRGVEHAVAYALAAFRCEMEPFVPRDGEYDLAVRKAAGLDRDLTPAATVKFERRAEEAARIVGHCGEAEFLDRLEKVVSGWYGLETPGRFDPSEREMHVVASMFGVTVHGYIDRLDRVKRDDGSETVYVTDYKTGKLPSDRFRDEAFFQLEIYALLLARSAGVRVDMLRLLYTATGTQEGVLSRQVDPAVLARTEARLRTAWDSMRAAADRGEWKGKKQVLCGWCHFKPVCPEFHPELEGLLPEEVEARLEA